MEIFQAIGDFFANLSLQQAIADYGYWAILIGTFLEGETILVLGGIAAQAGFLELHLVMLSAFCGSYAGDQLAFSIGRKWGAKILAKKPKWQAKADYLLNKSPRFLDVWMVIFRFFYGLRNPTPWVLGTGGVSYRRFLLLNGIGALLWAVSVAWLGYAFGILIEHVMEHVKYGVIALIIVLAIVITIVLLVKRRKKGAAAVSRQQAGAQVGGLVNRLAGRLDKPATEPAEMAAPSAEAATAQPDTALTPPEAPPQQGPDVHHGPDAETGDRYKPEK